MANILWALVVGLAASLAYTLQFSAETLSMGRALSSAGSRTGFQDSVTPPWQTNLALSVYVAILVVEGLIWWSLGWASALAALAMVLAGAVVLRVVLGKTAGNHYRRLILNSMRSRYAGYVRDRDLLRAAAMKELLVKSGIDP